MGSDDNSTSQSEYDIIIQRLQNQFGVDNVKELASKLGLSAGSLYNRSSAGTLPYAAIVKTCLDQKISLDAIFYGGGRVDNSLVLDTGVEVVRLERFPGAVGQLLSARLCEILKTLLAGSATGRHTNILVENMSDSFPDIVRPGDRLVVSRCNYVGEQSPHNLIPDGKVVLFFSGGRLLLRQVLWSASSVSLVISSRTRECIAMSHEEFAESYEVVGDVARSVRVLESYGASEDPLSGL